jgi:REP element-mobilizing transposase RayT
MTTVCDAVRSKCAAMGAELMAIAVAATHVHALVLLDEERVGTEVGMMKREASKWLAEKRPGGLWSRRCHPRRIFHPEHRQRAHEYIMAHGREGAVVWSAVLGTDAL